MNPIRTILLSLSLATCMLQPLAPAYAESPQELYELKKKMYDAMQQKDYATACEPMSRLIEIEPNDANLHNTYGFALANSNHLDEGTQQFLRATQLDPKLVPAWRNLAMAYQRGGKPAEAISALQQVAARATEESIRTEAKASIELIQRTLKDTVDDTSDTDYIKTILATSRDTWSAERQPVKVFIEDGTGKLNYQPEFYTYMKQAFLDWQAASGGKLAFEFVPTAEQAAINVEWATDPSKLFNSAEGGDCKTIRDGKGIKSAHIVMGLFDHPSQKVTPALVHWTALHEVGHACGLLAHSPKPSDVMYMFAVNSNAEKPALSARDKETIRKLYTGDNGPSWLALNDEGVRATQNHDFAHAIECYEKAMAMTDNDLPARNCAGAHFNLANTLMNSDKAAAEQHFRQAIAMAEKLHDKNEQLMREQFARFLRMLKRPDEADAVEKAASK